MGIFDFHVEKNTASKGVGHGKKKRNRKKAVHALKLNKKHKNYINLNTKIIYCSVGLL